ncbi:MAG: Glycine oxidase [Chlamydiales bacterium]|nr:Glycine oxidase [Chlamydiales bacterium]
MSTDTFKDSVSIIGGGVIGLAVGWQLLRAGIAVTLFDARKPKASSVAAGMLAPYSEMFRERCPLFEMGQKSLGLYPQFLEELEADSGLLISIHTCGTLWVGIDRDDARWLERLRSFCPIKVERLSGEQAREKEPLLSPRVNHALWMPGDALMDPVSLLNALKQAFLRLGGKLIEREVKSLPSGEVVVAAGVWSGDFGLPVRPLKGEIVTVKSDLSLTHMIRSPRVYLAPGPAQTIRLGATSAELGFDLDAKGESVRTLFQDSWEVMPALDQMSIVSIDVGLRPQTLDRLPRIGESEKRGVFYATGHGRGGFLLAPYTAYKLKEEICRYYSMACSKK